MNRSTRSGESFEIKAAIYDSEASGTAAYTEGVAVPQMQPGDLRLRVLACGVFRTGLDIVERDLRDLLAKSCPCAF